MPSLRSGLCAAAILAAATLGAPSAFAITYTLDIDHCTGGCATGSPPFATVTVVQNGANLDFSVQLLDSLVFNKSTAFDAFAFSFSDKVATIINIADNGAGVFASDPTATSQDGFGTFTQGITNTTTGSTLLTFTALNETLGNLIISTIPPGDTRVLFAADVAGGFGTGNTGNIGGGVASAVPEPATWGMMLLGFVGLGFAFRQSRRKVAFA
jgi:PEP-CTERM motif